MQSGEVEMVRILPDLARVPPDGVNFLQQAIHTR